MPPSEVADLLGRRCGRNKLYLLTDHEWDSRVIARNVAILGGL